MVEIYALGIERNLNEPYCYRMDLKEIDELFYQKSKEEVLQNVRENDSVITETDPEKLHIYKKIGKKWIIDSPIITKENHYILEFSFEDVLRNDANRVLNILYNHFSSFLNKGYVREEFKRVILSMKDSPMKFLDELSVLTYSEERMIRVYLSLHILLRMKDDYPLERKAS